MALAPTVPIARAEAYGDHDQFLTIGASAFRGVEERSGPSGTTGISATRRRTPSHYYAALALPDGALIEQVCMYAYDSDPGTFEDVETTLVAAKLVPEGGAPVISTVPSSLVQSAGDLGYGYFCSAPINYTLQTTVDVDGDGTPEDVVHYVAAYVPGQHGTQVAAALGGVRVMWKRQVSPPPATPSFGDVPTTDSGYPYIEALVASGITSGCGGLNFCPNASLTRRQMAVFLAKALGLHWAD